MPAPLKSEASRTARDEVGCLPVLKKMGYVMLDRRECAFYDNGIAVGKT